MRSLLLGSRSWRCSSPITPRLLPLSGHRHLQSSPLQITPKTLQLPSLKQSYHISSFRRHPPPKQHFYNPKRLNAHRQVRHCSYRNNMCRLRESGANDHPTAINTPQRQLLPADVKPIHYDLTLEPNLTSFEYHGTVVITYVCPRP